MRKKLMFFCLLVTFFSTVIVLNAQTVSISNSTNANNTITASNTTTIPPTTTVNAITMPPSNQTNSTQTNPINESAITPAAVIVNPSSAVIDVGQEIMLTATASGGSGNFIYQWYNTSDNSTVAVAGANATTYNVTALGYATSLSYYVSVTEDMPGDNTTNLISVRSDNVTLEIDPTLNITTDFYPPIINITSPHSYTVNALYNTQVSGGTGNYIYTWDTSRLPSGGFVVNRSCLLNTPLCEITAADVNESITGMLSVAITDTSDGNASYASQQYYFVTANPDPPLVSDYLDRNVSQLLANPLRIGVITPAAGQIVYGLGLGLDVVGVTDIVSRTLPSFGVGIAQNVTNIGLNFDYYLPDYVELLVNTTANYVPVDAGAFQGTLSQGLVKFQASGMQAVVLGGGLDNNITGVESDVMLVANTTGAAQEGVQMVGGMNRVLQYVQSKVSGTTKPKVAMIIWYGYGSMFADGPQSFIGSEISSVNAQNIFPGYYPSPSPQQLVSGNPDYIIASIFGTPYDNISTTYQSLATIPGIQSTNAWKNGRIYILGNLATNVTDEPGPLAAYGTLIYAIILHPQQFGFNQTTLPNNITDQWVMQNIRPSLSFAQTSQIGSGTQIQSSTAAQLTTTSIQTTSTQITTTVFPHTTTLTIQENLPPVTTVQTVTEANNFTTSVPQIQTHSTRQRVQNSGSNNILLEVITMIIDFFEKLLKYLRM